MCSGDYYVFRIRTYFLDMFPPDILPWTFCTPFLHSVRYFPLLPSSSADLHYKTIYVNVYRIDRSRSVRVRSTGSASFLIFALTARVNALGGEENCLGGGLPEAICPRGNVREKMANTHVFAMSLCPDVCLIVRPVVPMSRANMDSSAGRASPLHTCSSGGIIRPCAVLSSPVSFMHVFTVVVNKVDQFTVCFQKFTELTVVTTYRILPIRRLASSDLALTQVPMDLNFCGLITVHCLPKK